MSSKIKINKVNTMSKSNKTVEVVGITSLIGQKMTKAVDFMDKRVNISKLSVAMVLEVQELAKEMEAKTREIEKILKNNPEAEVEETEDDSFDILKAVIRESVEGASDLTDEDFGTFAMDELSKLSNEIMVYSGIGNKPQGK